MADGTVRCIDSEIPFDIPGSWAWARLKAIGITETGTTPSKEHPEYFGNFIPFLGPSNIQNNTIASVSQGLSKQGMTHGRIVPPNTILQVCIGGSIGKCAIINEPVSFNQQINSVTPILCNTNYIFYNLQSDVFKTQIIESSTGTATPIINRSNWESILIPIPPLEEQLHIAIKVEMLQPLIAKYDAAEKQLTSLNAVLNQVIKKSVLQEAIQGRLVPQIASEGTAEELLAEIRAEKERLVKEGKLKKNAHVSESHIFRGKDNRYYENISGIITCIDDDLPFDIPQTWSWTRLGEVFQHNTGKALNGSGNGNLRRKYLTTSNLYWDSFDFSKVKEMNFTENEIQKCTVKKGDLLVCEGGDIGRAAIWCYDYDMCIQNHIHRLRSYIEVSIRFFFYVLQLYKYRGIIGGKGIGIQGLSSGALHNLIIPIPPKSEQNRIAKQLDYILTGIMSR